MRRPKVIAFDLFGTVFDLSAVPRDEVKAYVDHIRKPEWSPLTLPDSWLRLWPYGDSKNGIERLRHRFTVVTCSNAPLGFTAKLSKKNGINWDAIIPLELNRVYKTNPKAYMTVCEVLGVEPADVLMVTANRTFGDLESSRALGMQAQLIRDGEENPKTIIELAERLEATE
jgi:2-haloacid dehalogenase